MRRITLLPPRLSATHLQNETNIVGLGFHYQIDVLATIYGTLTVG